MENSNSSHMFNLKTENGYIKAVAITLIVVCCIIVGGYLINLYINPPAPSGYNEMYLLDTQNGANNYPQVLVANQNSTFNQQISVTNKMTDTQKYQLQVKIVQDTTSFPVDAPANSTIQFSLESGKSWSSQVPVSINTPGTYSVVFELYTGNGENVVFTNNFCVLHVTVVAKSS
jgi:uncharacterized membrane protein